MLGDNCVPALTREMKSIPDKTRFPGKSNKAYTVEDSKANDNHKSLPTSTFQSRITLKDQSV